MRVGCAFFVSLSLSLAAGTARAGNENARKACSAAYEEAQVHRKAGQFRAAWRELAVCADEVCAAFIRTDCVRWSAELADEQPSVVVVARDRRGQDLVVRVSVDRLPVDAQTGAVSIDVDPGEHVFRFESTGFEPTEVRAIVRVGEKRRRIEATMEPSAQVAPLAPALLAPPPISANVTPSGKFPFRTLAYTFTALAGLGFGTFGVLGIHGYARETDLSGSCAPHCADDRIAAIRNEYKIADMACAIGIGAAVVAAALYLFEPSKRSASSASSASGTPGASGAPLAPAKRP
jgi:hypothetical protein